MCLNVHNRAERSYAAIVAKDFDLGLKNGGTYYYCNFTDSFEKRSNVARQRAWRRFVIISKPGYLYITVDGEELYKGTEGMPFDRIELEMRAPGWRPAWHAYFSDFDFEPISAD